MSLLSLLSMSKDATLQNLRTKRGLGILCGTSACVWGGAYFETPSYIYIYLYLKIRTRPRMPRIFFWARKNAPETVRTYVFSRLFLARGLLQRSIFCVIVLTSGTQNTRVFTLERSKTLRGHAKATRFQIFSRYGEALRNERSENENYVFSCVFLLGRCGHTRKRGVSRVF